MRLPLLAESLLNRFFAIVLPNASPGIIAAWLAIYVLCATEFSATQLIYPPGSPPLAPSIINLMRRRQDPEIAACQVLLLAVVALPQLPLAIAALWRRTYPERIEMTEVLSISNVGQSFNGTSVLSRCEFFIGSRRAIGGDWILRQRQRRLCSV